MKRTLSLLLAALMLLSLMPFAVFADSDPVEIPVISVENAYAKPGSTVQVLISVENNPGIVAASLSLSFDPALSLIAAENGDAFSALSMTAPSQLNRGEAITSSCNFNWFASDIAADQIRDGIILRLTFEVSEEAQINHACLVNVSATSGNVIDKNAQVINVITVGGEVAVIDYTPGDVDDNGSINMLDVVLLSRYIVDGCTYDPSGYAVQLVESAANVNDDSGINMLDVVLISRFIVDGCQYDPAGYAVKLIPVSQKCNHTLEAVAAKAATCTEDGNFAYWHCTTCGKYFSDASAANEISREDSVIGAKGHTPEVREAIPPTTMSEGYTEGIWCDVCHTWLSGHELIDPIEENEANITYRLWYVEDNSTGNLRIIEDNYLKQQSVNNPNPNTYVEGQGIASLETPTVDGYDFLGWFEYPEVNARRIYSISASENGDKTIYAVWAKHVYTITYIPDSAGSTLPKIESETFTVDKETALQTPSWPNLVWVGWSDEDGNVVKSIPKGTAHDVSLTANWMSKRNQTVPNTRYAASTPAIVEDFENGIIAFTYEIGDIQNVPIQQVEDGVEGKGFNLVKGATHEISKTLTQKFSSEEATNVSNVIANSTVKSDSWTLSEDWNKSTSFSQEHSNEITEEQQQKAQQSFSETGKYTLSSGKGATIEHIDENGTSDKTTKTHEFGVSVNAGIKAGVKKIPVVNAGGEVNASVGLNYKYKNEKTHEEYETHTDKTSLTWNVNEGFETSQTMSASQEFSQKLAQSVKDTYKYGEVLDFGGETSNTVSSSNTSSSSREYSSSVIYGTETGDTITVSETLTANADTGFYRKVIAANFRVFAVVIYDIESATFSTMTYSVKINDSDHLFTDYSTVSSFNDYENGVLPFSVPMFVGDYVYGVVGASDGLRIDNETGIIEGYGYKDPSTGICYKKYDELTGVYSEPCDTDVVIPRYVVVEIAENTKEIVRVSGFSATAFSGTTITSTHLNQEITEIPAGAFENCSELKYLTGPGITVIHNNAFKNCSNLDEMSLSSQITYLGSGAFDGDEGLTVYASSPEIVTTAMSFDVDFLTIDLSDLTGSLDGETLTTSDGLVYFGLNGGGKTFRNLKIESDAETTEITNIIINGVGSNSITASSSRMNLGFVRVNAAGLAMNLTADSTVITLAGNNYFESSSDNAILSKSILLVEKEGASSIGRMRITGNGLVFGEVRGAQLAIFDSGAHSFRYLTAEEYERYFGSVQVYFNLNCEAAEELEETEKTVYFGNAYGELPIPTRDYYTFDGWFTEAEGGTQITAESTFDEASDVTLYAHWTENEVSDWVRADQDQLPEDAQIVSEKWTYTYISNQAYSGTDTVLGQSSAWSDYGAWSSPQNSYVASSDAREVKTEYHPATYKTQYNYDKYAQYSNGKGQSGPWKGNWSEIYCQYHFEHGWSDTKLDVVETQWALGKEFKIYRGAWYNETTRQVEVTSAYTLYTYRDRHLIYTYELESASDPTGQANVSNVVAWVQYRAK